MKHLSIAPRSNRHHLLVLALLLAVALTANAQTFKPFRSPDSLQRIVLELPLLDMPYHQDAAQTAGGFLQGYTCQSMATSLAITADLQSAVHYGLINLCGNNRWGLLAVAGYDALSVWLPFGPGWLHEEYHRGVMAHRGVNSFDEVWLMHIGSSSTSVSHETDEALTILHDQYRNDFIRMNSAGLEGLTHISQTNQRMDFFHHRNLYNYLMYWINASNNVGYIYNCMTPLSGETISQMNANEPNIADRDFTGFDLNAWAYELFHPDVTYADRGTHPSGNGINRYITYEQIGAEGVAYLKRQFRREMINFISPTLLMIDRFYLGSSTAGDWYGNFAMHHYLTHFGDDISMDLLLETPWAKGFVTPHLYSNLSHYCPGIDVGVVDYPLWGDKLLLSAQASLWQQPLDFRSSGQLGGSLSADLSLYLKRAALYLQVGAKSAGFQAGEVSLEGTWFARTGFRYRLK